MKDAKEGYQLYRKIKSRFAEASFNVRKWVTNDEELEKLIIEDEKFFGPKSEEVLKDSVVKLGSNENEENLKVLGISWNHKKDTLNLGVKKIFERASILSPTKRNILRSIASIFDPCGFLQHITINLKILFQEVCLEKSDWDDVINENLREKWAQIIQQLIRYQDLEIERHFSLGKFLILLRRYICMVFQTHPIYCMQLAFTLNMWQNLGR